MPDQYTLAAFQRLELAPPDRAPVMAEIDLVSSHTPWAPLPQLVDWDAVGDGSVFDGDARAGPAAETSSGATPTGSGRRTGSRSSTRWTALVSFVPSHGDDNLVLVVLGDHQPATVVSGAEAPHDVPITVIARDPAVLGRIAGWGWQTGLRPSPAAPVWRMDAFRDRFLAAYGPRCATAEAASRLPANERAPRSRSARCPPRQNVHFVAKVYA